MNKARLEAFSDGVIAIIITIMVLEIKEPHSAQMSALGPLLPIFLSYLLSFIFVGIYWINHHNTMQTAKSVSGAVLWSNLHLLFWLSLIPFSTSWMGENHFMQAPIIVYGVNLIMTGLAYFIWSLTLIQHHGKSSLISKVYGTHLKSKFSLAAYLVGIGLSFVEPLIALIVYALVAIGWLIPDRQIKKLLTEVKK